MTMYEPIDSYLAEAREQALDLYSGVGIVGHGAVSLYARDGSLKHAEPFTNKISDYGDQYYCTRAVAAVAPTAIADVASKMTGVKLGTSSATPPNKATGNNLGAYQTGSLKNFTSTAIAAAGSSTGYSLTYTTNWTGSQVWTGLVEAVICDATGTDAAPVAVTNVISRVTFSAVNKGATDTFAIVWIHTFLGG